MGPRRTAHIGRVQGSIHFTCASSFFFPISLLSPWGAVWSRPPSSGLPMIPILLVCQCKKPSNLFGVYSSQTDNNWQEAEPQQIEKMPRKMVVLRLILYITAKREDASGLLEIHW